MKRNNKSEDFHFNFKEEIPFEKRVVESKKIMEKFIQRIPVIIEKAESESILGDLE